VGANPERARAGERVVAEGGVALKAQLVKAKIGEE
jgi:hypothetical protein